MGQSSKLDRCDNKQTNYSRVSLGKYRTLQQESPWHYVVAMRDAPLAPAAAASSPPQATSPISMQAGLTIQLNQVPFAERRTADVTLRHSTPILSNAEQLTTALVRLL